MKVSLETVQKVIQLARAYRSTHEFFMEKYYPSRAIDISEFHKYDDTPEHQNEEAASVELEKFLMSLKYEQVLEIESLMLAGRGDSGSFESNLDYFSELYPNESNKDNAVDYITSKIPLDTYLEDGLKSLRNK